jgi:hypothetical protein
MHLQKREVSRVVVEETVGRADRIVADHAIKTLAALPVTAHVWAVGERVCGTVFATDIRH